MPSIEITLPRTDAATRERLAHEMTRAFAAAVGCESEILGIHFREYGPGEAAVGGRLWTGDGPAYLHIAISSPRLPRAAKVRMATDLTAAFTAALGRPDWQPVIHLAEHPYDNVAVNGKLLSDAFESCAKRPFYYDLPRA